MIEVAGDGARLSGPVTLANVTALLAEGRRVFAAPPAAPALTLDLAAVTDVDSTAVSLLLEWRREAARGRRSLRYINLPPNLLSLMTLYGVSELLA